MKSLPLQTVDGNEYCVLDVVAMVRLAPAVVVIANWLVPILVITPATVFSGSNAEPLATLGSCWNVSPPVGSNDRSGWRESLTLNSSSTAAGVFAESASDGESVTLDTANVG